jgi:hypothetical protein
VATLGKAAGVSCPGPDGLSCMPKVHCPSLLFGQLCQHALIHLRDATDLTAKTTHAVCDMR